jgi:hypothetical protein
MIGFRVFLKLTLESYELSPGFHTFLWQYSKRVENSDDISKLYAKIEYIEIEGVHSADYECKKCIKSSSLEGSSQCEFCQANFYFDESLDKCVKCPEDTYSDHNSVGMSSCKKKAQCLASDYSFTRTEGCFKNNTEIIHYSWNSPKICSSLSNSVLLPAEKFVHCSKCTSGQFLQEEPDNKKTVCQFCPSGYYSELPQSSKCKKCDGYTPKRLLINEIFYPNLFPIIFNNSTEWTLFNNKPSVVYKGEKVTNFILEQNFEIMENQGSIKYEFDIYSLNHPTEILKITLLKSDGEKVDSKNLFLSKSFYERNLQKGVYKVVIMAKIKWSNRTLSYKNKALISLNYLKIENSDLGGGYICKPCPHDTVFNEKIGACVKCRPGTEIKSNLCNNCTQGFYNNGNQNKCLKCPEFTYSNEDFTSCSPYDIFQFEKLSHRYLFSDIVNIDQQKLCSYEELLCYNNFLGPIYYYNEIFYFSPNVQGLPELKDFSYSKISNSKEKGYIFLLKSSKESKQNSNIIFDNTKILVNTGSEIDYIKLMSNRKGFVIKYSQGDKCLEDKSLNYSSYLIFTCHKESNSISNINKPFLIKQINNNCTHIFEWQSRSACPSCHLNETNIIEVINIFH